MKDIGQKVDAEDVKPCKHFDLIGCTSTEGLIAIMLGTLGVVPLPLTNVNKQDHGRVHRCLLGPLQGSVQS